MMVKILRDTIVRMPKGAVIEVSDKEAARLAACGNAAPVPEKQAPQKAKKKTEEIAGRPDNRGGPSNPLRSDRKGFKP